MAETLVHEFQHVKLGALMDVVPLVEAGAARVYAPWRQDPRAAGGLLQGAYAHLAIARFWNTQRHVPADPDGILRAQAMFARWRPTIGQAARTLIDTGCLTRQGKRFVEKMHAQGWPLESEAVPGDAREIAEEVALDHQLTWHMRHMEFEPADVARLATAYGQGESRQEQMPSPASIQEDTRKVESTIRSRLLNMRCLEPARFRELRTSGVTGLSPADVLLVNGESSAAVQAYRDQIAGSVEPQPDAWIGLALALHRLHSPQRETFTAYLALLFDISIFLGGRTDPLHLAGWLA